MTDAGLTAHVLQITCLSKLEQAHEALTSDKDKAARLLKEVYEILSQITNLSASHTERQARCMHFGKMVRQNECDSCNVICAHQLISNEKLPFFQSKPNADFDEFYCGCHSWN